MGHLLYQLSKTSCSVEAEVCSNAVARSIDKALAIDKSKQVGPCNAARTFGLYFSCDKGTHANGKM